MTRCATVDEALDLLERLPRGFAGAGMLADRDGRLALVEIGRKRINVTERLSARPGGAAVNVNCWVGMQAEEGDPLARSTTRKCRTSRATSGRRRCCAGLAARSISRPWRGCSATTRTRSGSRARTPGFRATAIRSATTAACTARAFDPAKPAWGTVSAEIIDPAGGVFWYTYGWPCGEAPEHGDQLLQERAWGTFLGFPIAALPAGEYTTLTGELTPLAIRHLRHLLELDRATGQALPKRAAA